jgi:hypothetical protein
VIIKKGNYARFSPLGAEQPWQGDSSQDAAASGGSSLFDQYAPFAILKPKNRKTEIFHLPPLCFLPPPHVALVVQRSYRNTSTSYRHAPSSLALATSLALHLPYPPPLVHTRATAINGNARLRFFSHRIFLVLLFFSRSSGWCCCSEEMMCVSFVPLGIPRGLWRPLIDRSSDYIFCLFLGLRMVPDVCYGRIFGFSV